MAVEPNNGWKDGGDAEHHQTILLSRPLVSCIVDVVESVEGFLVEVFFPEWFFTGYKCLLTDIDTSRDSSAGRATD